MVTNHRENQGDPELLVTTERQPGGWSVEVKRGGTVAFSDRGYMTEEGAWAAGKVYVRALLKASIARTGIGRRAERPVFDEALARQAAGLRELGVPLAPLVPAADLPSPLGELRGVERVIAEALAAPDPIAAPPAMPFVCTGCGQPSPGPLPGAPGGRVFCSKVDAWVPAAPAAVAWSVELGDPAAAPALEGEALCSCGHTDGVHLLGANTCAFERCRCEEFNAAPSVEAVQ